MVYISLKELLCLDSTFTQMCSKYKYSLFPELSYKSCITRVVLLEFTWPVQEAMQSPTSWQLRLCVTGSYREANIRSGSRAISDHRITPQLSIQQHIVTELRLYWGVRSDCWQLLPEVPPTSLVWSDGLMSTNISSVKQQYLPQPLSYYNLAKLSNHLTGFLLNEASQISDQIYSVIAFVE